MKRLPLLLATVACACLFLSCAQSGSSDSGKAKYIFVMIGDGMGMNQVTATESYLSYKAGNLGAERLVCSQFPILGLSSTYSANYNITDSAAGGTAIATGHKTYNGAIGVDADKQPVYSMATTLGQEGYKVGIMSSVPVNHATPAAFYAHQENRNMYYEIGLELPASQFEFFAGSGILELDGKEHDLKQLNEVYEENGYRICYGVEEIGEPAEDESGVIVLQPTSRQEVLNYEINRDEVQDDRLADVLKAAIGYLGDEQPFFIMCEGGEIDWGAHANNIMSTIESVLRFDEAIGVAYDFYLEHPDETLIIVTADHETGGLALGSNKGYMIDWEGIEEDYPDLNVQRSTAENRAVNESHNIGWTTSGHTGTPVPVYAVGKGAEKFCGRLDNTDIYGKVMCE